MKRLLPRLMLVAVFSVSATLAEAQAVARGGGGGGSSSPSSSSSGGGSSSSGGGGGSTASSSGSSSSSGGSYYTPPAPIHSAPPRTPSHSGGSASSGGSSSNGSSSGYAGTASRRTDGSRVPSNGTNNGTAPTYARPDGTNYNGRYAIRRQAGGVRPPIYYYPPYYAINPWGFGFFGYGYGLDYFYDPFYYGYGGYPGYYGYGYPGYGYFGANPGGWDNNYYGGGTTTPGTWEAIPNDESTKEQMQEGPTGELRIKVKPREAKVIVDGVTMGTVDDFDGFFQKMPLREGRHHVTLQLDGYEPLSFDVMIVAGQVINYHGDMHKIGDKR